MEEYKGMYVTLMLCSDCNNRCEHCYINYGGSFTDEKLSVLVPTLLKKYKVLFNGTEPIIHQEYLKYYQMAQNNILMTNGIALKNNELLMDKLLSLGINEIAISYHYGIQDSISMIKTHELDEIIHKLKEKGFIVKLMCSLSTDNYMLIEDACIKAISLQADIIRFTNFINQGSAIKNYDEHKFLNRQQIDYVLLEIQRIRNKFDKNMLYIERCGTFGKNQVYSDHFKCMYGENMVAITPDGRVYGCIFDTSRGNELGFIDEEFRIWISESFQKNCETCRILKNYNNIEN